MSRYSYLVTNISNLMMIGAVMVLAVFGTYTVSNNFDDVVLMFTLGFATYIARKYGFSAAPLVLGIILGPIVENNFSKGRMIAESDLGMFSYFFTGTTNLIIIGLCLLSLGWSLYSEVKFARSQKKNNVAAAPAGCAG